KIWIPPLPSSRSARRSRARTIRNCCKPGQFASSVARLASDGTIAATLASSAAFSVIPTGVGTPAFTTVIEVQPDANGVSRQSGMPSVLESSFDTSSTCTVSVKVVLFGLARSYRSQ
ncbi:MAG: hypothetical protein ABIO94_10420, partial [Opitutaceae bacterium]